MKGIVGRVCQRSNVESRAAKVVNTEGIDKRKVVLTMDVENNYKDKVSN